VLLGRWEHRVTVVVGGPGFGKTTLVSQALAENRLTPRGEDVWIGLDPVDADDRSLAAAVSRALALDDNTAEPAATGTTTGTSNRTGTGTASASTTSAGAGAEPTATETALAAAQLVWQRSPRQVCVILDDVHLLAAGSAGAAWLAAFVDVLPDNGHVLLAGRTEPAIPLARLEGLGAVVRIEEEDLRLSPDECRRFAARRSVTPDDLEVSGGWPAMAELAATARQGRGDAYLWEEVLRPLGDERRRLLGLVCDLGGADDALASAAAGEPVDLATALAGVPLVAVGGEGWFVPHALWRTARGVGLDPAERAEVRRRAVDHLTARGSFDDAFDLIEESGLWDMAPAVLRAAALSSERLNPRLLERCLAASPGAVRTSAEGALAAALRLAFTQPAAAIEPLRAAAAACRSAGDVEGELTALAQLGRLAWGRHDTEGIGGPLIERIAEIEATGHPTARGLAAFVRALAADLAGDDKQVLAELDGIEPGVLDPVWEAMAVWFRGGILLDQGDAAAAAALLPDDVEAARDPAVVAILGGLRTRIRWATGHVDEAVADIPPLLKALRAAGVASIHAQGLTNASLALAFTGDPEAARQCLTETTTALTAPIGGLSARTALALASVLLAEGDEGGAASTLRSTLDLDAGPDRSPDRRALRHVLSLSYVLVPETRPHWDAAPLRGHLSVARELARAVVATRDDKADERLWRLQLPPLDQVRAALHHRFAAELAVGLSGIGRAEGARLLDALGPVGRNAVRDIAGGRPRHAKAAKALLAAVPAPPAVVTQLEVLGPLAVWREVPAETGGPGRRGAPDGLGEPGGPAGGGGPGGGAPGDGAVARSEVIDPDLRRSRVRGLLAFLVSHRRTRRAAITAALWPDLDDRSANNNLGVTLNHMLRSLEPWRTPGEPPYLVRLDGPTVELVTGPYLRVDIDDFDEHLRLAARAEAEGSPSVALDHLLAATALYRGDLFADIDVPEAEWIENERTHRRNRFVTSATRAAGLLVGQGDTYTAEDLAQRALTADPWSEDAYAVLATAGLAREDLSAARRSLQRCLDALADLGAAPSATTLELLHRAGIDPSSATAGRRRPA
jgi:ATP/maltotriose-dependent transcriptional regulator MalT/DNA-binding SARP family transcriptional activator